VTAPLPLGCFPVRLYNHYLKYHLIFSVVRYILRQVSIPILSSLPKYCLTLETMKTQYQSPGSSTAMLHPPPSKCSIGRPNYSIGYVPPLAYLSVIDRHVDRWKSPSNMFYLTLNNIASSFDTSNGCALLIFMQIVGSNNPVYRYPRIKSNDFTQADNKHDHV
jgi:hypothetical protein